MKNFTLIMVMALMMQVSTAQTQLWGTAQYGGTNNVGTIFSADGNGNNFHIVYSMDSATGAVPQGGMILANNGNFYGVTSEGGCQDSCVVYVYNTISGTFSDIHDFYCDSTHGVGAFCSMTKAANGKLYGLCMYGGFNNDGVLYEVDPSTNTYTDVYDFSNISSHPAGSLIQLSDGKLYGITESGLNGFHGTLFSYDPSSADFNLLYSFPFLNSPLQWYPKLIQATDGNLYGMTENGGTNNDGLIFRYEPVSSDTFTIVHNFNGSDGSNPYAGLIQASNGLLYGTTAYGGTNNFGEIFSYNITTDTLIVLHSFNDIDGAHPQRNLMQASNGILYGTTWTGGAGNGVAFSFDVMTNTFTRLIDFIDTITGTQPECELMESPVGLGIPKINNNQPLTLFPNPATTSIILHSQTPIPNSQLIITDVLGNTIFQQLITHNSSLLTQIDISTWSEGIYFYEVIGRNETTRGKFIKE